jgi:hypothetical protein
MQNKIKKKTFLNNYLNSSFLNEALQFFSFNIHIHYLRSIYICSIRNFCLIEIYLLQQTIYFVEYLLWMISIRFCAALEKLQSKKTYIIKLFFFGHIGQRHMKN